MINTSTDLKEINTHFFSKGKISIIIPCFNEETMISKTIEQIKRYLSQLQYISSWELILINDGSTDKTGEILESYKSKSIRKKSNCRKITKRCSLH